MMAAGLSELLGLGPPTTTYGTSTRGSYPVRRAAIRDSQRKRLYRAEDVIKFDGKGRAGDLPPMPGRTLADVQSYVDRIVTSAWWRDYVGVLRTRVTVEAGKGYNSSDYRSVIRLRWRTVTRFIVLHELAHQAADARYGARDVAPHGPEFSGMLRSLVQRFMGQDCARQLAESFKTHRVKSKLPRKIGAVRRVSATF